MFQFSGQTFLSIKEVHYFNKWFLNCRWWKKEERVRLKSIIHIKVKQHSSTSFIISKHPPTFSFHTEQFSMSGTVVVVVFLPWEAYYEVRLLLSDQTNWLTQTVGTQTSGHNTRILKEIIKKAKIMFPRKQGAKNNIYNTCNHPYIMRIIYKLQNIGKIRSKSFLS